MAKKFKSKKTLFFIEGVAATEAEMEAAAEFEPGVQFRSVARFSDDTAIETFDHVAGAVPARYRAVLAELAGETTSEPADALPGAPGRTERVLPVLGKTPAAPKPPVTSTGWTGNA